jgi:hypothetical protein
MEAVDLQFFDSDFVPLQPVLQRNYAESYFERAGITRNKNICHVL